MPLDMEKYRRLAHPFNLSEQERDELIKELWTTLESFVDRSFGRHPLQQYGNSSGHNDLQGSLESLESKGDHLLEHRQHSRSQTRENSSPS